MLRWNITIFNLVLLTYAWQSSLHKLQHLKKIVTKFWWSLSFLSHLTERMFEFWFSFFYYHHSDYIFKGSNKNLALELSLGRPLGSCIVKNTVIINKSCDSSNPQAFILSEHHNTRVFSYLVCVLSIYILLTPEYIWI